MHVTSSAKATTYDLFEDTGWWRGSNLYQHLSGGFVLHEGQAGCLLFDTLPHALDPNLVVTCDKVGGTPRHWPLDHALPAGAVSSRFFNDLVYLGHFAEGTGEDPPIRFIPASDGPEPELPDPL